ncbi:MAG: hypothetical protein HUJ95_03365 [Bacteroidales bacterium]|nr:hypothetical protein [Bacteroidales bacterium]
MILTFSCKKDDPKNKPFPEPEIVDLGLSVDWASWNVGSRSETDYGQYFAWGETASKEDYSWGIYHWGTFKDDSKPDYGMFKYTTSDNIKTLQPDDDVATKLWGSNWRTPTTDEIIELLDETKCDWTWTTKNGVKGYTVTSKVAGYQGKNIFLPAAGFFDGTECYGRGATTYYWSSSLKDEGRPVYADCIIFSTSYHYKTDIDRCRGIAIRAVTNPHPERHVDVDRGFIAVDLGLSVKWASCNIGTHMSEAEYGDYFAWGETYTKSWYESFYSGDYKWGVYNSSDNINCGMTKYNQSDGILVLEAEDDAATKYLGSEWRTPTAQEFRELLDNSKCECNYTTMKFPTKEVNGYIVTSKVKGYEGEYIFLPIAGYFYKDKINGDITRYWTSSLRENRVINAYCLSYDGGLIVGWTNRHYGFPIRAVTKK